MDIAIDTFIKLNKLSTGRRLFCQGQVREEAQPLGFPALVAHIDEAIAHDQETYELDKLWAMQKSVSASGGTVLAVDNLVDKTLSGLRDGAEAQTAGAEEGEEIVDQVSHFLDAVFPGGVYAVTSLPHVEQLVAVESIVDKLQGELAPLVVELGLGRVAARLAELAATYREVQTAPSTQLTLATVDQARTRGQTYLVQTVALIVGRYYRDSPEHEAARAALLGPILAQNQAVRAYLSARRAVRDVDPDTGAPADGLPADDLPAGAPGDVPGDVIGDAPGDVSDTPAVESAA